MRVLVGSSEVCPFSKTGGLGDVVGALGKFLGLAGVCVDVVTPLYGGVLEGFDGVVGCGWGVEVRLGGRVECGVLYRCVLSDRVSVYFVGHDGFFGGRVGVYGEGGVDYGDNGERFLFFGRVLLELCLRFGSDVVHVHDWPGGLLPVLLRQAVLEGRVSEGGRPRSLLTVHNLAYQGVFSMGLGGLMGLDGGFFSVEGLEFYGGLSFLKGGVVFADGVSTVSPSYAEEVLTGEFGCGLDGVLRGRGDGVYGILNGVDYSVWRTEGNGFLGCGFSAGRLGGKGRLKGLLLGEFGLPRLEGVALFGMVSRLVEQKGVGLLVEGLEVFLRAGRLQFVLLGEGDVGLEGLVLGLARRFPGLVGVRIGYDEGLAHRVEGGCDFYLMPSRFEPCGLNQLYSLRYGTVPIVHAVGGLRDSVVDVSEDVKGATGVKFFEFSVDGFVGGVERGLGIFGDSEVLDGYRRRGMGADFSWERAAGAYVDLYGRLLGRGVG